MFTSALRKPSAGQGVREESQLGPLPPQPDGGDILRCLIHEVTYPEEFFSQEGFFTQGKIKGKTDSQGLSQDSWAKSRKNYVWDFIQGSFQSSHSVPPDAFIWNTKTLRRTIWSSCLGIAIFKKAFGFFFSLRQLTSESRTRSLVL